MTGRYLQPDYMFITALNRVYVGDQQWGLNGFSDMTMGKILLIYC